MTHGTYVAYVCHTCRCPRCGNEWHEYRTPDDRGSECWECGRRDVLPKPDAPEPRVQEPGDYDIERGAW
jgi:DNA-directed RNA polymerase subunit RPC12/RpoP